MKALITLLLVFWFSALAMAQDIPSKNLPVTPAQINNTDTGNKPATELDKTIKTEVEVARLYRFKHSKVLKELTFTTKRNSAKLA
jgi:hypothetical protein